MTLKVFILLAVLKLVLSLPDQINVKVNFAYEVNGQSGNELNVRCPEAEGYIMYEESKQCFKLFKDRTTSWEGAKSKCESHGLKIAEFADNIAINLRKYLLEKYGSGFAWVGAKANGTVVKWLRNNVAIPNDSPLWYPYHNQPVVSSDHCLQFLVHTKDNIYTSKPYYSLPCNWTDRYPLCEVVL